MTIPATWVFDVDGCIVDSLTGGSLRPGARRLLAHLHQRDLLILVWSAGGAEYAQRRADQHDLADLVHSFHSKNSRDDQGRYRVDHFLRELDDVVFIDDQPNELPARARSIGVRPYLAANQHDSGLRPVASLLGLDLVTEP